MPNISMPAGTDPELFEQLQDSVAAYCARALPLRRQRELRDVTPTFDPKVWREIAELGWLGLIIPEACGGLGFDAAAVAIVCRELGRVTATEPFIETAIACGALLSGLDAGDTRLLAMLHGEAIFTCPLQARTWQNFTGIEAEKVGVHYTLCGELANIPIAPDAEHWLLPANCDGELAIFYVRRDAPGVEISACRLADGSRDGRVTLKAVRCLLADRISIESPQVKVDHALALAGIGAAAYLLGLCEALLDITLEYLRTRRQFGRALGTFQALQHRLADLYLQIRLTNAAVNTASESDEHNFAIASTRARHRACETASLVIREAIQMHGAIGYTEQCDVALYVQRALVTMARYGNARAELNALPAFALGRVDTPAHPIALDSNMRNLTPSDGDWNRLDDRDFRSTVRQWVEANYPTELRHVPAQLRWAEIRGWHQQLVARGWVAPAWPREHGGMGLAPNKMLIFIEELERWGVARAPDQGIVMIGPILLEYGTPDQRERYLKKALTGEQIWCQGYSEPNAGSDLASLTTSAVVEGEEFIVNGQKTWTTHGLDATHMYCLVRTDPRAKPQAGISFLLIDLNQPGVTVRPIRNLGGHVDFCEVFLEQVRVPRANLVGPLNQGWTIAKSLLGHERLFVGSPKLCQHALHQLRELALARGLTDDPVFMDSLTRITLDVLDLEALYSEYAGIIKRGGALGADVAVLKIWSSETYVRLSEMIVQAAGELGAHQGKLDFGNAQIDVLSHYYNARPAPIYAGSNEIQRNILAKHVLQLPS